MEQNIWEKARAWAEGGDFDETTRHEIQALIDEKNEKELQDRFWKDLEFGTGGLRGILGAGTNRMNVYNIRKVTQGLANYIILQNGAQQGVVIGRDSRNGSLEFAREAASVLVANGIRVYFFRDICPTPVTSFTILKVGAKAGIMNTASHNPREYNGYKVFWDDGAQLVPPHDELVMQEIKRITELSAVKRMDFAEAEKSSLFEYCDSYFDHYIQAAKTFIRDPELCRSTDLKILYSPLHGAGYKIVPQLMNTVGFRHFEVFQVQAQPNGNFPSAPYPNPEDPQAMQPGIKHAEAEKSDLFIATDPDADRIGVACKSEHNNYLLLNGNQIGALILDYLIRYSIPQNSFVVSTIVSSPLISKIARAHGIEYAECLTGFRWISAKMEELQAQGKHFLFGMEESHGYNISALVHDKDGISAAAIFAELAAFHKHRHVGLDQALFEIAKKYGYFKDSQESLSFPGAEGVLTMQKMMDEFRAKPFAEINGIKVEKYADFETGVVKDAQNNPVGRTNLPKSNVFVFYLENNARIVARPSGTEPKIKFYFSTEHSVNCEHCVQQADTEHLALKEAFLSMIRS